MNLWSINLYFCILGSFALVITIPCLFMEMYKVEKIMCVFNLLNYDVRENCYFERLVTEKLLPPPQNCWILDI